jgi:predicted branched-subunit amino acid permease
MDGLSAEPAAGDFRSDARAFVRGLRDAIGIPLLVLMATFAGFVGLARDAGLELSQTLFMVAFIWALPAQVVLVSQIISGASLAAAFLAVTLSSVRLMPMVVALLPELKSPATRRWTLFAIANYIAVTSWVIGMTGAGAIPRERRIAWFAGVEAALVVANLAVTVAVYALSAGLPPLASGLLAFLMPTYFLASLWTTSREIASRHALVAGLVVGPTVHAWSSEIDLIAAGLAGGIAGAIALSSRRR